MRYRRVDCNGIQFKHQEIFFLSMCNRHGEMSAIVKPLESILNDFLPNSLLNYELATESPYLIFNTSPSAI